MLCPYCGTYAETDDIVCPACGKTLPHGENQDTGVMAIRQGKRAREEASSGTTPIWQLRQGNRRIYVEPETRPVGARTPVYTDPELQRRSRETVMDRPEAGWTEEQEIPIPQERSRRAGRKPKPVNSFSVNWMIVLVVVLSLVFLAGVGTFAYLRATQNGQRILARLGYDANSAALWEVGEEQMNTGDLERAVASFEKAAEKDGDGNVNVPGLLTLGSAYEALGRLEDAEAIYVRLYTDVVPSALEPYTNEIRILQSTGRDAEAAVLMQTAYQKTGSATFSRQRAELLPQQPVTDITAGQHNIKKTMHLSSPQGYDIYYIINNEDAVLPADGTKYEDGIFLDEGTWTLRAVCVNGDLVSDELRATYYVALPSPSVPRVSLAPGTYKQRQRVRIWPSLDNMEAIEKGEDVITLYYTIDGSIPNADSPIFRDGDGILLKTRKVTLRAVAVNSNGKPSFVKEVTYVVEANPKAREAYVSQDVGSIKLNSTTYEDFSAQYGEGDSREDLTLDGISNPCRRFHYDWGYATFQRINGKLYIVELYCTTDQIKAPRATQVGMSEEAILGKFCDMGQVESPSGNRGLYSNDDGTGKIYKNEDGSRTIRYIAYTVDGHHLQLDYQLDGTNTVAALYQRFIP